MADDNSARYRSSDPYQRGPAKAGPASDPLAELARLIGQSDPFAEFGRESRASTPRNDGAFHRSEPAPPYNNEPAPHDRREPVLRHGTESERPYGDDAPPRYNDDPIPSFLREPAPQFPDEPAPRYAADYPPRNLDDQPPRASWSGEAAAVPGADPFALPPQQPRVPGDEPGDAHGFLDRRLRPDPDSGIPAEHAGHDPAGYQPAPEPQPYPPALYPQEPDGGPMPPPHDDEFYDEEPRGGRRKGLLTVAAVLALAVIGTAGAFGYRNLFGRAGSSAPPPVIRASVEPSKVAPPPANADQTASKFSYDRFGDRGKDEQVVTREEKPVDPKDLARSAVPRTVLPGAPAAGSPPAKAANGGAAVAANPPSVFGEPRRVRTVPIRPDQPDVAAAPQTVAPSPLAPPRQTNVAAAAPTSPPPEAMPAPSHAPPPAAARTPSRPAPRVAARPAHPAVPVANAPLSLSPESNNSRPPANAQASVPPRAVSAPMRVASAPSSRGGGRYMVQVSSQRSEAEAQSSFRSIQAKYSSVLGGQPHIVRRADLGSKGIYYRAMVGPFGSREEAIRLCTSLKSAGGACVVQAN